MAFMSFHDFIPNWTAIKRVYNGKAPLEITKRFTYYGHSRCPVGEAFGSSKYHGDRFCTFCNDMSFNPTEDAIKGTSQEFYDYKLKLFLHYLDRHPSKVTKK